ncbi:MAG: ABC transporter substrate-binding protein [Anaerolineae bacterium]|nr:ABC transporter substrate-binding protein [Anaerolineae bacterium]
MKRNYHLIVLVTLLLASLLLITACTNTQEAPADANAESIKVTDALGREVVFEKPPTRIVVAGRGTFMVCDTLFMFPEAKERIAAMESRGMNVSDFLPFVDETFNDKGVLDFGAGAEQIAPYNPDAVVLKTTAEEELGQPLEELGIPVVYIELETPEQFYRDIKILGQLFNNESRAEEIIDFLKQRLQKIEEVLQNVPEAEKPRVLLFSYSPEGDAVAFKVSPASWMQTIQVKMAGGIPVWAENTEGGNWNVVNFEQLAQWDPDKIFVIAYKHNSREIADQLAQNPQWQELRAIKNGEIYGYPADFYSWDMPDPRWILGVSWLSKNIYPEQLADINMEDEIYRFFKRMYALDAETIDNQIIPNLRGDLEIAPQDTQSTGDEAEATEQPTAEGLKVIAADGQETVFTTQEIQELTPVEVTVEEKLYAGPALLDILAAAGIGDFTNVTLIASDEYSIVIEYANITPESLLDISQPDSTRFVEAELPKDTWVKGIVTIEVQ